MTVDNECDPSHPSNSWLIRIKDAYSDVLKDACYFLKNELGEAKSAFLGAYKEQLFLQFKAFNQTSMALDQGSYLQRLTEEDLDSFLDDLVDLWSVHVRTG